MPLAPMFRAALEEATAMTEDIINLNDLALTNHAVVRMYARRLSEEAIRAALNQLALRPVIAVCSMTAIASTRQMEL
jgi:hypothetical protein